MINEVLNDVNEDYLDAQEEKKEKDGRENEGADDGNSEDNQQSQRANNRYDE